MKESIDIFRCDRCGTEGQRFLVVLPDGTMILDRCEKHEDEVTKLKDTPGEFQPAPKSARERNAVKRSSAEDIQRAIAEAKGSR